MDQILSQMRKSAKTAMHVGLIAPRGKFYSAFETFF